MPIDVKVAVEVVVAVALAVEVAGRAEPPSGLDPGGGLVVGSGGRLTAVKTRGLECNSWQCDGERLDLSQIVRFPACLPLSVQAREA